MWPSPSANKVGPRDELFHGSIAQPASASVNASPVAALPGGEKAGGGKNGADAGRAVEMTAGWKARKTLLLERERTKVLAGVSHSFHRPWKSLRDSHIPTATTNPILSDEQGDISIELPRGTFLSSLDIQPEKTWYSGPLGCICRRVRAKMDIRVQRRLTMTRRRSRAFEHRGHASRGRRFQSAVLRSAAIIIFLLFGPALTLGLEESEADVAAEAASETQGPTSNETPGTEPEPGAAPPVDQESTKEQIASDHTLERMRLGFHSLWFTTVPLLLGILVIISAIWIHEDKDRFTPYFGEGQFLQLVVIVLVAGNVCSLAIMDVSSVRLTLWPSRVTGVIAVL